MSQSKLIAGIVIGAIVLTSSIAFAVDKTKPIETDSVSKMTVEEYKAAKQTILDKYNDKSKDYDFDINDREILYAILNKEIKEKGFRMEGSITKETLKIELLKLLK